MLDLNRSYDTYRAASSDWTDEQQVAAAKIHTAILVLGVVAGLAVGAVAGVAVVVARRLARR